MYESSIYLIIGLVGLSISTIILGKLLSAQSDIKLIAISIILFVASIILIANAYSIGVGSSSIENVIIKDKFPDKDSVGYITTLDSKTYYITDIETYNLLHKGSNYTVKVFNNTEIERSYISYIYGDNETNSCSN